MSANDRPAVTIGLPVRDAETTLPAALSSIRRQSFPDWELLVVDDGSSDGSADVVAAAARSDSRIRLVEGGGQRGLPARLNQLLELARGEYFARMDADDVAYPARLERQVGFLRSNQGVDLVGSSMLIFGAGGSPIGKRSAPPDHRRIVRGAGPRFFPMFHPTWTGRTEWLRRYGYRPEAHRCEDQDLLLRAHRDSTFANITDILLGYREEKVRLRPILVGRVNWIRSLWTAGGRRRPLGMVAAIAAQGGKGLLDMVAVGLGAERYLLPQRAASVGEGERREWREVWDAAQPVRDEAAPAA